MATGADEPMGDDVYQPQDTDVPEEGRLEREDTLLDREADPYEEGWSPPERPLAVIHHGTTANEQRAGETLDERLAEEVPDPALDGSDPSADGDGVGDASDTDGEPWDEEVGNARAGRLVAPDEGAHGNDERTLLARDVGIDGAAASAEEAAVHRVADGEEN